MGAIGTLWAEFKAFAFKGNMIELAVAVIIGGAFGTVVTSLTQDVIMPTIGYVINTGEKAAATMKATAARAPSADPAQKAKDDADAKAKAAEPIKIDLMIGPVNVGKFIGALLNFLIVAFAVFIMVVKLMGSVMKKMSKPEAPGEPTTRECPECLSIIPIKAKRCSYCTAAIAPGM